MACSFKVHPRIPSPKARLPPRIERESYADALSRHRQLKQSRGNAFHASTSGSWAKVDLAIRGKAVHVLTRSGHGPGCLPTRAHALNRLVGWMGPIPDCAVCSALHARGIAVSLNGVANFAEARELDEQLYSAPMFGAIASEAFNSYVKPSGAYSKRGGESKFATACSSSTLPNPLRSGCLGVGPPRSCH